MGVRECRDVRFVMLTLREGCLALAPTSRYAGQRSSSPHPLCAALLGLAVACTAPAPIPPAMPDAAGSSSSVAADATDSAAAPVADASVAAPDAPTSSAGAADATSSAADAATPTDAAAPTDACPADNCAPAKLCAPQETTCDGGKLAICASDGQSWNLQPCSLGTTCSGAAGKATCAPWQCTPNATECAGDTALACAADGLKSSVADDCAKPDSNGQPRQCVGGQCLAASCQAGKGQCAGKATVAVCKADGTGWTALPCPSGKACEFGSCAAVICMPGMAGCSGTSLAACSPAGTAWLPTQACPPNLYCTGAPGKQICDIFKCPQDEAKCTDDGSLWQCEAAGNTWVKSPCGPASMCVADACKPKPAAQTNPIDVPDGPPCPAKCSDPPACSPDDGCGAPCPACLPGPYWASVCANGTCAACAPNCSGKLCGPDGCGGWCGTCPAPWVCSGASCVSACAGCPVGGCKLMGFELGLSGWNPAGDTAVVGKFGNFAPPTGAGMLRLSTGVAVNHEGSAATELCAAANATKLRFKWRFCSTELYGYCGSTYQDRFWLRMAKGGKPAEVFAVQVDDFCAGGQWKTAPAQVKIGDDPLACGPWLQTTLDLSEFLPKASLQMGVTNVGDGGHPSLVLVDDLEFLP